MGEIVEYELESPDSFDYESQAVTFKDGTIRNIVKDSEGRIVFLEDY